MIRLSAFFLLALALVFSSLSASARECPSRASGAETAAMPMAMDDMPCHDMTSGHSLKDMQLSDAPSAPAPLADSCCCFAVVMTAAQPGANLAPLELADLDRVKPASISEPLSALLIADPPPPRV